MGNMPGHEPGKTRIEHGFESVPDNPKAYYDELRHHAGKQESLGPPIDSTEAEFWKRIEDDKPAAIERWFERVFGMHDTDLPPTFPDDQDEWDEESAARR